MVRLILLSLSLLSSLHLAFARDAGVMNEEILHLFQGFNPSTVLKGYTENPKEATLKPDEDEMERLKNEGFNALPNNQDAQAVFESARKRPRVRMNPKSPEMVYAGHLLEKDEEVLHEKCYQKPASCIKKENIQTCDESMHYRTEACGSYLNLSLKYNKANIQRHYFYGGALITMRLNACEAYEPWCSTADLIVMHQNCERLKVSVTQNQKSIRLTKEPTCTSPMLAFSIEDNMMSSAGSIDIHIEEVVSEEHWTKEDCSILKTNAKEGKCEVAKEQQCKDENQTRVMDDIAIKRPCWGVETSYRCIDKLQGCETLLNETCSQIDSLCTHETKGYCDAFHQTFRCTQELCLPEQTICPGKIYCADGSCDETKAEISDDFGEGVSRLGALAGGAKEVADKQIDLGATSIFTGVNHLCRLAVDNIGNCCGGKERIFNCREEEKELAKAKEEGRAYHVGTYCEHDKEGICFEKKESWCVFPTKLAAIFQMEGRLNQLHIPFGEVTEKENFANCRGLKPEELEKINFQALNLKPLEAEWVSKMVIPDANQSEQFNQGHIEKLYQEGKAHD